MTPHYYKSKDKNNPNDLWITRGQCLRDFQLMLNNTLEEMSKTITDRPIQILDPCCGTKVLECADPKYNIQYDLYDIEPIDATITKADFLNTEFTKHYDLAICNPPFTYKKEFSKKLREICDNIIFISPVNAIPYYEYSLKIVYKTNFHCQPMVGIWHYDKSKENNTEKYITTKHKLYEKYFHHIDYEQYSKEPDKWFIPYYVYIDPRRSEFTSVLDTTEPSLFDTLRNDTEYNLLLANKHILEKYKANKDISWTYQTNGLYTKKGQPRLHYALRTNNKSALLSVLEKHQLRIAYNSLLSLKICFHKTGYLALDEVIFEEMKPYLDLDYEC